METAKASSKKIIINYGVILGVVSILISVISYISGSTFQPHWSIQLLGFAVFIGSIVYAFRDFKKSNGGFMKLTDAFKIGLGVAIVSALIGAVYFAIFTIVIEPNYFEDYMSWQREMAIEQNPSMPVSQIDAGMEMQKPFMNLGVFVAVQIVIGLFFGFIISLIAGLVMKKENPYADA